MLLSRRSRERIDARIRDLTPRTWGRSLDDCIRRVNGYLRGWIGFFSVCSVAELQSLHGLDAHIRRRLRAIVLKHWKRRRTIARKLIHLGVNPKLAWRGIYEGSKSLWALSHSAPVDRGLRNAYFAERGLVSLEHRWWELNPEPVVVPVQFVLEQG